MKHTPGAPVPRRYWIACLTVLIATRCLAQHDAARAATTVIIDDTAVQNLGIATEMVESRVFESTVFAVGRIEEIPANRYSISSRIEGRAVEINAFVGDRVKQGDVLARVESRQPGDPPPTISLEALHDGLVVNSHVLRGQPVHPDTDLMDISDRSHMWAVAKIPEQEAARVTPGTRARIVIPALGGDVIEAELLRYGVTADREAGTVEGVFAIPNPDERLLPGMRVEFSIIVSYRPDILAVPREAVQGDPSKRVVYIKDFEIPNAFIRAPVVLGEENDRYVEVISGMFPGDDVVTRGSYFLGFVGSAGGMSLKEALDAAHGHEHNEDGSRMTPQQVAAQDDARDAQEHHDHHASPLNRALLLYAVIVTGLCLGLIQSRRNAKRTHSTTTPC